MKMSHGCFDSNADLTADIVECECQVHIKGSFADNHHGQDDGELSAYAAKHRCWRDLLLFHYEEGEWEFARRMIEFNKEQKRMSRSSSRVSNNSYCGNGNGFAHRNSRLRSLAVSGTPSPLPTPVSFTGVSSIGG